MAHSLGMSAIVEAVETATQVEIVRSFNADAAQGFFFARPMSKENALILAGGPDIPQFSRTEIRTWVRPNEPQAGNDEPPAPVAADDSAQTVSSDGPETTPDQRDEDVPGPDTPGPDTPAHEV
jgi:hypothetical protein